MHGEKDIGFEIRTLSNLIRRDVERNIANMDPKPNGRIHGWAINYFYENRDRDIFQKDFEEKFSIRRSTASNMLKLMEKDGYIKRVSVENDARLKKIVLTDKGRDYIRQTVARLLEAEIRAFDGWSEDEIKTHISLMEKYTESLRRQIHQL